MRDDKKRLEGTTLLPWAMYSESHGLCCNSSRHLHRLTHRQLSGQARCGTR